MEARVEAILVSESTGEPMRHAEMAELVVGVGIAGDRYALKRGHWSDLRWPDQEITLFEAEVAERLALRPEQFRRNLVTRGVRLESLIGVRFAVGGVLLEGVRRCDPCRHIEQYTRDGMLREIGMDGGLRARIIRGGTLRAGDAIAVLNGRPAAAEKQLAGSLS